MQLLPLQPSTVALFERFTFSHLRSRLSLTVNGDVAIGAYDGDQAVGLIYAYTDSDFAQIASIFVKTSHRGLGIGTALLSELESHLDGKVGRIHVAYPVGSSVLALERTLEKCEFSRPSTDTLIYRVDARLAGAPWFGKCTLARNARVVGWTDVTLAQRQAIASGQGEWFPLYLSPFRDEGRIDGGLSLVLLVGDQPMGWCMAHQISQDARLYTSLVVHPKMQHLGYAFSLVAESVERQVRQRIPYGLFAVLVGNHAMLSIVQKWIAPYALQVTEQRSASKVLVNPTKG